MHRSLLTAVLGLLLTLALAACGGGSGSAAPSASASAPAASDSAEPAPSTAGGCTEAEGPGEVEAAMSEFTFTPDTVTVSVGQTVTWTNGDSAPHTATLDDGSCGTEQLSQGQSGSLTFGTAGTYPFHCAVHPDMKGTVEVTG